MNVWLFRDSGAAYDCTQCQDEIANGDILVIPSENVVGILVEAWPIAVTPNSGVLETVKPAWRWNSVASVHKDKPRYDMSASYRRAMEIASQLPAYLPADIRRDFAKTESIISQYGEDF